MNIGRFSVTNPVLVDILMVAILFLGLVSFIRLPRELQSDISFSWVFIAVPYPGAPAQEIEKNVTIKIEEELKNLDKLKRITSITREGVGFVQVEFDDKVSDQEFARLYQDVRAEFDKVPLPDGTLDPMVDDFSSDDFMALINLVVRADSGVSVDAVNRAARQLQERILDVDEVSKADMVGFQEREIRIEADAAKLDAFGVSLDEIAGALRSQNVNIPGGTIDVGSRSYILQTLGQIQDPAEFGSVIVRRIPGKGSTRISDVATVTDGYAEADYDARMNGQKSISVMVSKTKKGNSLDVVDGVREVVDGFRKTLPAGITITYSNDTTVWVRRILNTLGWNSLLGFVSLVLVLFLFLGFRNSLITALGIPLTFAITFMFMQYSGESLNGNSLFALVLVLGMIVDHAIVIMENSYRHRQLGLSRDEAAIVGTNEVVKPIVAATGTSVAAFLPLMLLPGIMGKFMRVIPVVVSLALAASTLEALLFLPVHFAKWGGKVKEPGAGFIGRWQSSFKNLLERMYRRRYLVLLGTLGLIVLAAMLTPFVKQNLFAGEEFPQFFVDVRMPPGTPRHVTDKVASRFEERLLPLVGNGEVKSIGATIGFMITDTEWLDHDNYAQLTVELVRREEGREKPMATIMEEIEAMCSDIPGPEQLVFRKLNMGPPVDKPVSFRLLGDDYADMSSISRDCQKILQEYEELYNIGDNFDKGMPELRIKTNTARAAELGLSAAQIGMQVRNSFEGIEATVYYDQDEEIDVVLKLAAQNRQRVEDVSQLKFRSPDGRLIPFSAVCAIERGTGMGNIRRRSQKREITVSADTRKPGDRQGIKAITERIQRIFKEKYRPLYKNIALEMGGEFAEFNKVISDVLQLFWIGLFLMYMILGAQFKSFLQPFLMIFTLPLALVGCILFLVVSGTAMSIVVIFAGVALAGIAVNDSIVLISFINGLRRQGVSVHDAVIQGAGTRLRPIILTSVTTIGGLLPMAIGLGGSSETWAPMASTIIFGLFFSTMGTLLVIPCAYGAFSDLAAKFGRKMELEGE